MFRVFGLVDIEREDLSEDFREQIKHDFESYWVHFPVPWEFGQSGFGCVPDFPNGQKIRVTIEQFWVQTEDLLLTEIGKLGIRDGSVQIIMLRSGNIKGVREILIRPNKVL